MEIPKQQEAFNYQNKISGLFNNGLQSAIENVLDETSLQDEVIRIDTLTLDLGIVDSQNFEKEFTGKLITALKNAILKEKGHAGSEANMVITRQAASHRDAFIYFLIHGTLPWYVSFKNMPAWQDELFTQWQQADWQYIAQWIKEKHTPQVQNLQDYILKRLVLQFSHVFLARLAEHMYSLIPGVIRFQAMEWRPLFNDLFYIAGKISSQNTPAENQEIWMNIFSVLLQEEKAAAEEEAIIAKLIFKQIQTDTEQASSYLSSHENELLQHIEAPVVKEVIHKIAVAFNNKQPNAVINDSAFLDIMRGYNTGNEFGQKGLSQKGSEDYTIIEGGNSAENTPLLTKPFGSKDKQGGEEDIVYASNCGLILLHPFLSAYFSDLGLLENKKFINIEAQQRAILLLFYLATGEKEAAEFNLVLQKILCGYPLEDTLGTSLELSAKETEESEQLLRAVIDYWPPLKNTSIAGFRDTFLQRSGKLSIIQSGWLLRVEQRTVDILLGKLPWGFSTIRLAWMQDTMNIEWA